MFLFQYFLLITLGCNNPEYDGNSEEEKGYKKTPPKALLVESTLVKKGTVSDYLETTGTLESIQQANIIPETNGTIKEIFVREGDEVEKGQSLATLINPSLDAGVERANIELERARRESDKADTLHSQGAISDRDKLEAESALLTAQTAYKEASSAKGYTILRSPIQGVISFVDIREGELAGGARAFQVVNPTALRIVAAIPEQDLTSVREGQPVTISATYDESLQVAGSIERIAPVVDPQTGTLKVFINLEPNQSILRPGQFVRAQIEVDTHSDVLTIPKSALVYKDGEAIAFIIEDAPPEIKDEEDEEDDEDEEDEDEEDEEDEDEEEIDEEKEVYEGPRLIASLRRLELGFVDANLVEIKEGLLENEQVVTIGNASIRDKSPIRIASEQEEEALSEEPSPDTPATPEGSAQ
jgi:membrane fusion protein, multidrug efflux system